MYVEFESEGAVGVLKLNRSRTNSLDPAFLTEISDILTQLETLSELQCVIMTSELKFGFSSGLDLGALFTTDDSQQTAHNIAQAVGQVYQISQQIIRSPKIFIAALTGPVIGSALSMALSCDLCIATSNTWFWVPEPQYGGLAADGIIETLNQKIGAARAAMLLLTNERFDAKTAGEWGVLYQIVDHSQLNETARALARRLAKYSGLTMAATKELINVGMTGPFEQDKLRQLLRTDESYRRLMPFMANKK